MISTKKTIILPIDQKIVTRDSRFVRFEYCKEYIASNDGFEVIDGNLDQEWIKLKDHDNNEIIYLKVDKITCIHEKR